MGNILQRELLFTTSRFIAIHRNMSMPHADTPYCKMITDFLAHEQSPALADLPLQKKAELHALLACFFEKLTVHSRTLLLELGAENEASLPATLRAQYDARMKAFVVAEDHYP